MEPAVLILINAEELLFEKQIEVKLMCMPPHSILLHDNFENKNKFNGIATYSLAYNIYGA